MQCLTGLVRDVLELYGLKSEKEFYINYLGYSNFKYNVFKFLDIPISDKHLSFIIRLQLLYRTLYSYNVPHDRIVSWVFKWSPINLRAMYHELKDDYAYYNLINGISQKFNNEE